eukprot:1159815-Pelagomonas_calceolata.AAC.15
MILGATKAMSLWATEAEITGAARTPPHSHRHCIESEGHGIEIHDRPVAVVRCQHAPTLPQRKKVVHIWAKAVLGKKDRTGKRGGTIGTESGSGQVLPQASERCSVLPVLPGLLTKTLVTGHTMQSFGEASHIPGSQAGVHQACQPGQAPRLQSAYTAKPQLKSARTYTTASIHSQTGQRVSTTAMSTRAQSQPLSPARNRGHSSSPQLLLGSRSQTPPPPRPWHAALPVKHAS